MGLSLLLQKLLDQLIYNQLYAPHYPEEDRTSLSDEEQKLLSWLADAQGAATSADTTSWLNLAGLGIRAAIAELRQGSGSVGRKEFGRAAEYVRNALLKKSQAPRFISGEAGTADRGEIQEADPDPNNSTVH